MSDPKGFMYIPSRMSPKEAAACERFAAAVGIGPLFLLKSKHHGQHSWCCADCNRHRAAMKERLRPPKQPWEVAPEEYTPVERRRYESHGFSDVRAFSRAWGHDQSFVYFIQAAGKPESPVKIGVANDPMRRIKELQTGYPFELTFVHVAPGGFRLEKALHTTFKDSRSFGEWFSGPGVPVILGVASKVCQMMHEQLESGAEAAAPPNHHALVNMAGDVRRELAALRAAA